MRIRDSLHKLDQLVLARTCRLNWAERNRRAEPRLTILDALEAPQLQQGSDVRVEDAVEAFKLSFAAFLVSRRVDPRPWYVAHLLNPEFCQQLEVRPPWL